MPTEAKRNAEAQLVRGRGVNGRCRGLGQPAVKASIRSECFMSSSRHTPETQIAVADAGDPRAFSVGHARLDKKAASRRRRAPPAGWGRDRTCLLSTPEHCPAMSSTHGTGALRVALHFCAAGPGSCLAPQDLRPSNLPSWRGCSPRSSPQRDNSRPSGPRAAFSNSSSLGRRPAGKGAVTRAPHRQFTFVTGNQYSWPRSMAGCGQRRLATQRAYMGVV